MNNPAASIRGAQRSPYADPFVEATVTGGRVDQGVDYSGSGPVTAIAAGVITEVRPSDPGWDGSYLRYKITQPGPLQGQSIYIAEGLSIAQGLQVGDTVNPGDMLGTLVSGSSTGIETGFAAGDSELTYANQHGGAYTAADSANDTPTAAGEAFSDLIHDLGGPAGRATSTKAIGSAPPAVAAAIKSSTPPFAPANSLNTWPGGSQINADINAGKSVLDAAKTGVSLAESFANFLANPVPTLLTVGLVILGGALVYTGARRMLGTDNPEPQAQGQRTRLFVIPRGSGATGEAAAPLEEIGAVAA